MLKLKKYRSKYVKLYSLKKGNKTIFQIEDMGDYVRIYPIYYPVCQCKEDFISIDISKKKKT